jgi:chloride channel protein, CIC family
VWRSLAAAAGSWIRHTSYVRRWVVLGTLIGVIAGCGAVVFYAALQLASHLFLHGLAGYTLPTPAGEGGTPPGAGPARAWALPLIAAAGALLGAILVCRVAPEAEGHGTDAAIAAVHHNPRGVRFRAVLVKIVASALTIGSGGSGGREGPTGQISAGFGSLLARVLDLEPADARVAVATGIGAGIGAIFGAPLGGAVLSAEILYRDDFDPAALLPTFIAAGVGYAIFGAVDGYHPIFGSHAYHFTDPSRLIWFALIGVLGGLIGLGYAKGFYGLQGLFARLRAPRWLKPAIGGAIVGLIAIEVPEVMGTGYGWIQQALGPGLTSIPLWIVLILPFARILATGLSIGSGGSGGIFGPGMVIGAFVGAAVWRLLHPAFPWMGPSPAPYVIVGMMCCFGSIARAPLAMMLMVAEMTGSIGSLEPGVIAVGIAWLIATRGQDTIYRSQLPSRAATPARRLVDAMPLLTSMPIGDALAGPSLLVAGSDRVADARRALADQHVPAAPVVDEHGRFEGTVSAADLHAADPGGEVRRHVDAAAPVTAAAGRLDHALDALTTGDAAFVSVLDDERRVLGTVSIPDVVHAYRRELEIRADRAGEMNGGPPS